MVREERQTRRQCQRRQPKSWAARRSKTKSRHCCQKKSGSKVSGSRWTMISEKHVGQECSERLKSWTSRNRRSAKMRHVGRKLQSLREKHSGREGQIEQIEERCNVQYQPIQDAQTVAQDAHEELQSNAQQVAGIDKEMLDYQKEITRLQNTNEGLPASDARSVQQGSAGRACCEGSRSRYANSHR